jgi:hypothetical protein
VKSSAGVKHRRILKTIDVTGQGSQRLLIADRRKIARDFIVERKGIAVK